MPKKEGQVLNASLSFKEDKPQITKDDGADLVSSFHLTLRNMLLTVLDLTILDLITI